MKIDIWYPGDHIAGADCIFYPNDGEYRGNVYNANGRAIGDFSSRNSVEIERRFPGIFGKKGGQKMTFYIRWYERKPDFSPDYYREHHGNIHGNSAAECMTQFRALKYNHDLARNTIPEIVEVAD